MRHTVDVFRLVYIQVIAVPYLFKRLYANRIKPSQKKHSKSSLLFHFRSITYLQHPGKSITSSQNPYTNRILHPSLCHNTHVKVEKSNRHSKLSGYKYLSPMPQPFVIIIQPLQKLPLAFLHIRLPAPWDD